MVADARSAFSSGGCQYGHVRFPVASDALGRAAICHCRMGRKAFGNLFVPLVAGVGWAGAAPERFRSFDHVSRGFCIAWGVPLTDEAPDGTASAFGAFNDPAVREPTIRFGREAELFCACRLADLPERDPSADLADAPYPADIVSCQHPVHETDAAPATEA